MFQPAPHNCKSSCLLLFPSAPLPTHTSECKHTNATCGDAGPGLAGCQAQTHSLDCKGLTLLKSLEHASSFVPVTTTSFASQPSSLPKLHKHTYSLLLRTHPWHQSEANTQVQSQRRHVRGHSALGCQLLIYQPLQLLLLCQQLQKIEQEGNVVVFAPDVLIMPVGSLVLLSSQLILKPARTQNRAANIHGIGKLETSSGEQLHSALCPSLGGCAGGRCIYVYAC